MDTDTIHDLMANGDILECPQCGELSAYSWDDCNIDDNGDCPDGEAPIYHIGACSGLGEWQCGACHAYLVERDSILLAECFTHVDPDSY